MKKVFFVLVLITSSMAAFGLGSKEIPESVFKGKYVVAATDVKNRDCILVDARGKTLSTINGAVVLKWQELATCGDGKPGDANWGVILDKARLDKVLGDLGLDLKKEIIVFGDCNRACGEEGRIAWELLAVGYRDVKFVDGGYQALVAAGFETALTGTKLTPVKVSTESVSKKFIIDTDELSREYANFKVVDTRTTAEYNGAKKHGEKKGGRLPKAISIKFTDIFQANGLLKSNAEIESLIQAAGIKKTDKIVAYCTAGIRSAYMQLIFDMLGYDTRNYDESFYRWCVVNDVE